MNFATLPARALHDRRLLLCTQPSVTTYRPGYIASIIFFARLIWISKIAIGCVQHPTPFRFALLGVVYDRSCQATEAIKPFKNSIVPSAQSTTQSVPAMGSGYRSPSQRQMQISLL